ncbi:hypothetical protein G6F57_013206 [Rhizopus arrhizus]|nr:hypothetical protein G6F57_013206 [Rhizopus arrhizus]
MLGQRFVVAQPFRQIGVGDERSAKRDQIGPAGLQRIAGAQGGVLAGVDQHAGVSAAQRLFESRRHVRRIVPVGLGDVDVAHADLAQALCRGRIGGHRVRIHAAVQGGRAPPRPGTGCGSPANRRTRRCAHWRASPGTG